MNAMHIHSHSDSERSRTPTHGVPAGSPSSPSRVARVSGAACGARILCRVRVLPRWVRRSRCGKQGSLEKRAVCGLLSGSIVV